MRSGETVFCVSVSGGLSRHERRFFMARFYRFFAQTAAFALRLCALA
jgi:hypothetical protein